MSFAASDWMIAISTLLAPLVAIQVSRWLDDRREHRNRQVQLFSTLMATRAANLDARHVEALNSIDVVFAGRRRSAKAVRDAWKVYLDHLTDRNYPADGWNSKRVELIVELLSTMGTHLGFDFDKAHLKNQAYFPQLWGGQQDTAHAISHGLARVLTGADALPVKIVMASGDQPDRESQAARGG